MLQAKLNQVGQQFNEDQNVVKDVNLKPKGVKYQPACPINISKLLAKVNRIHNHTTHILQSHTISFSR